jgi:hypothetical protein
MMYFTVQGRFRQTHTTRYMLLYKKEWYEEHGCTCKHGVHITATNDLLQSLLVTAQ